jgi:hypothetical protein
MLANIYDVHGGRSETGRTAFVTGSVPLSDITSTADMIHLGCLMAGAKRCHPRAASMRTEVETTIQAATNCPLCLSMA